MEFDGATVERLGPLQIVGNVRLDARWDLWRSLPNAGGAHSDLALCLHAYAAWGESFVDRLSGDFCFALWDDTRRCLIAVRDRLGIRPLFHASVGGEVLVSDSLDWIMAHDAVPTDLDDVWIGDFLTVGFGLDFDRTVRRHIRRVPPAHLLKIADGRETVRRYWQLEIAEPLHFKDRRVYTERFLELVDTAIKDRLPPGRIGISMSGGLDSTMLAACTVAAVGDPARVIGECHHFERLMPDEEAHFGTLAARHLGIELRLQAADDLVYDSQWRERGLRTAEPTLTIVQAHPGATTARAMAADAGVWFFGEGPDNALAFDRDPYFAWLVSRRDWWGLAGVLLDYVRVKGLSGWRATVARRLVPHHAGLSATTGVPAWIDPDFARRVGLPERLQALGASAHPWHPQAVGSFESAIWPALFDDLRYAEACGPFEWRHPFLDLRVLEYMMALPPVPWAWRKHLLRKAMADRLPPAILARDKTALARQPLLAVWGEQGLPSLSGSSRLAPYVTAAELPPHQPMPANPDCVVAAHALDHWLVQE